MSGASTRSIGGPRRTRELTGGGWIFDGPDRHVKQMLRFFRKAGYQELAAELEIAVDLRDPK